MAEFVSERLGAVKAWAEANPGAALLATNAATAGAFLLLLAQQNGGVVPSVKALFKGALEAAVAGAGGAAVDAMVKKTAGKIQDKVLGDDRDARALAKLPAAGLGKEELLGQLRGMAARDRAKWESGQVSGAIYHGGDALTEVIGATYTMFALSNPLHPELFPSVRNMEAEVVAWCVDLFHGDGDACGAMTSGGTESILLACRAYREWGRTQRGIVRPNMVVPTSAHAAFHKAGDYFGIEVRQAGVDPVSFKADLGAMEALVDGNTVLLVASAIQFPQGVLDPVAAVAALAARKGGIPVHVDSCLGSFVLPFANAVRERQLPPSDFAVRGVTSISCDTHKFGYAPKGSSVIMYASQELRALQFYVSPRWTGGVYATPTIAGSRAGALVAATWATMRHVGADGYKAAAAKILGAVDTCAAGVRALQAEGLGVALCGEPDLSVLAFGPDPASPEPVAILSVFDAMSERGWQLNALQSPASVHLCVTYKNADKAAADFVADLRAAILEVKADGAKYADGMGKIYGMADSIPVDGPVVQLSKVFLSSLYALPQGGPEAAPWWETKPDGAAAQ